MRAMVLRGKNLAIEEIDRGKAARKDAYVARARKELSTWIDSEPLRSSA